MTTRGLADDVRLECRLRLESLLQNASLCLPCTHPDAVTLYAPPPSGIGKGRKVGVDDLIGSTRLDGVVARAWVIGAEEGRGHASLAQHFAHVWCTRHSSIPALHSYQGVMALTSDQVSSNGCWEAVKDLLPDTVARWGAPDFAEWMEENRVLLIIDDFDYRNCREHLEMTLEEWTDADFLLLTSPSYVTDTAELFSEHLPTIKFTVQNMTMSTVLKLLGTSLSLAQKTSFGEWCEDNWSITKEIVMYPDLIQPLCCAWKSKHISPRTTTATELLWNILEAHVSKNIHMEKELMEKWFLSIGQKAKISLEDRNREPIKRDGIMNEAQDMFPGGFAEELIAASVPCLSSWLSHDSIYFPHPVKQFLAAWDVIHQNLKGISFKLLTKYLIDEDNVVIYASGHLVRILELQPQLLDPHLSRSAKNLILHMDRAKDRFEYILRVIHEIHSHPWIMDVFKKEIVFSRHWEVHDKGMLTSSLETLLQFNMPDKILLLISKQQEAPDLEGVVRLLAKNNIPMCLLESNHLEWESSETTDNFITILQEGNTKVEDIIGCLRADTILSLGETEATRNIVCLRVRVTDLAGVDSILNCPKYLPSLLWLEPDFDLPLSDLENIQFPVINTGLMDVCFKDICDEDIPFICEVMSAMRKNYSGVHLTRSSVTPRGVIELLKQFYKRSMKMSVDINIINRYRRWRFPILAIIPKTDTMTQEKVQHLLGYDDRHHYNDNEVISSAIADPIEAGALANFLTLMEDLVCFRYACANFLVIKKCNGTVETKKLM